MCVCVCVCVYVRVCVYVYVCMYVRGGGGGGGGGWMLHMSELEGVLAERVIERVHHCVCVTIPAAWQHCAGGSLSDSQQ